MSQRHGVQDEWGESFGLDAQRYDRARPSYPDAMVADILAASPGGDVLDVGSGTGISVRLFVATGANVLGVEVDPRMAELAGKGGLQVEVAPFEVWEPAGRTFDAVVAGQAWHWVDADAGRGQGGGRAPARRPHRARSGTSFSLHSTSRGLSLGSTGACSPGLWPRCGTGRRWRATPHSPCGQRRAFVTADRSVTKSSGVTPGSARTPGTNGSTRSQRSADMGTCRPSSVTSSSRGSPRRWIRSAGAS